MAELQRNSLGVLPAVLDSDLAVEVGKLLVESGFTDQALTSALSGQLVERAAENTIRFAVIQRVSKEALAGGVLDQIVERVVDTPQLWALVEKIAGSHPVAQALGRQADGLAGVVRDELRAQTRARAEARRDWLRHTWRQAIGENEMHGRRPSGDTTRPSFAFNGSG